MAKGYVIFTETTRAAVLPVECYAMWLLTAE
jgi:hypothetical protein